MGHRSHGSGRRTTLDDLHEGHRALPPSMDSCSDDQHELRPCTLARSIRAARAPIGRARKLGPSA